MQDLPNQKIPGMDQAREDSHMVDEIPRKGVKTRLFGVVLIFLGALDSMLFWRGGLVVTDFFLLLIVSGVAIYIIGAIRANESKASETQLKPQR